MQRDPYNPFDDKAMGLAMMGAIFFCASTGTGIGVFFQQPEVGGLTGAAVGIVVGIWLVPALMREWRD